MLILQEKENIALKEQIASYEQQLHEKRIAVDNVGSLAEASFAINGVCEAVDKAANQYLDNIKSLQEETQKKYEEMVERVEKAQKILEEAEALIKE